MKSRKGAHHPFPPGIVHEAQILADIGGWDNGAQTHTFWTR